MKSLVEHFNSLVGRMTLAACASAIFSARAMAAVDETPGFETGQGLPGVSLLPILGNLLLVLCLVVAGGWFLSRLRMSGRVGDRNLRVIASQPVGAKEKIMIVEVGEQQLVVGLTPSSINTLYVPSAPLLTDLTSDKPGSGTFAAKLRQSMQRTRL